MRDIEDRVLEVIAECTAGWDKPGEPEGASEKHYQLIESVKSAFVHSKEWDGTGLPPVGATVEYNADGEWFVCEIVGIKENVAIYWDYTLWKAGMLLEGDCRPIRTEAEKQREADINEITKIASQANFKTERELAVLLVDAGFTRKQDEQKPQ